jgi:hypothetical protein
MKEGSEEQGISRVPVYQFTPFNGRNSRFHTFNLTMGARRASENVYFLHKKTEVMSKISININLLSTQTFRRSGRNS